MGAALPWIAVAATVSGAMQQASGAQTQAAGQNQQAQYQAAVARNNQLIAEQNAKFEEQNADIERGNAEFELQRGQQMEAARREDTAQAIGMQIAKTAASGITIDSATPLRNFASTASLGEVDALTIRNNAARSSFNATRAAFNAERAAYNYRASGNNQGAQANLYESAGANALRAGEISSTGSIIGGAGSVADKWLRYSQAGIPGAGGVVGGTGGGAGFFDGAGSAATVLV